MIVALPAPIPVTIPFVPMPAIRLLLLLQPPPAVASVNRVVKPTHTLSVPVIAAGFELMVTIEVLRQPVVATYVITAVPEDTPVTIPVEEPTVALPLLLLHVPPAGAEFNVVVNPTQTFNEPVIIGLGLMVTGVVTIQPAADVYVMVAVPAIEPVTIPEVDPIPALVLLLLHVPPAGVEFKEVVKPTHTFVVPVIAVGLAFMVTMTTLRQPVVATYVITDVPEVTPVTIPVVEPTVAWPLLLLHAPPAGVELSVVVNPTQTFKVPVIIGLGLTVTGVVIIHPVGIV